MLFLHGPLLRQARGCRDGAMALIALVLEAEDFSYSSHVMKSHAGDDRVITGCEHHRARRYA